MKNYKLLFRFTSLNSALMQGYVFTCSPQGGATYRNWRGLKVGALTRVAAHVTLANAMSPSDADITFGKISEGLPSEAIITMTISGKAICAVMVTTDGYFKLRYMSGTVPVSDFSFNVVY